MLNVFITNVSAEELTVQQADDLYKIRWQIELVFKVWKSILKIHLLRKMRPERVKCYLYGKLLWILLCWDITVSFEPLIWKQKERLQSLYKCYALLKTNAQQLIKHIQLVKILFFEIL
jgi:IS4 transposase